MTHNLELRKAQVGKTVKLVGIIGHTQTSSLEENHNRPRPAKSYKMKLRRLLNTLTISPF
jgi:hypothetical protein